MEGLLRQRMEGQSIDQNSSARATRPMSVALTDATWDAPPGEGAGAVAGVAAADSLAVGVVAAPVSVTVVSVAGAGAVAPVSVALPPIPSVLGIAAIPVPMSVPVLAAAHTNAGAYTSNTLLSAWCAAAVLCDVRHGLSVGHSSSPQDWCCAVRLRRAGSHTLSIACGRTCTHRFVLDRQACERAVRTWHVSAAAAPQSWATCVNRLRALTW